MVQDEKFVSSSNSAGSGGGDKGGAGAGSGADNNSKSFRELSMDEIERIIAEHDKKHQLIMQSLRTQSPNIGPNPIPAPLAPPNSNFGPPNASNLYRPIVRPQGWRGHVTNDETGLRGVPSRPRVVSPQGQVTNNETGLPGVPSRPRGVSPQGWRGQVTNDETGLPGVPSRPRVWSGEYNNRPNARNLYRPVASLPGWSQVTNDETGLRGVPSWPEGRVENLIIMHLVLKLILICSSTPMVPVCLFSVAGPNGRFIYGGRLPHQWLVNVSSGTSQSLFSSSKTEPEDNYTSSSSSSSSSSSWPEDNKIGVGMKRAYPFDLERMPAPTRSFHSNFHAPGPRFDEFPSLHNIRNRHLSLTLGPEQNPVEDTRLTGDFLTLAPPVAAAAASSQDNRDGASASTEQTEQTSEEKVEKLDLNLKL
ncbi:hypothetical protein CASFOL_017884 [Castilleja foliolosa]|uniref:Uncharacterized protein n=1 Tax=Castilleja foliolosa TaxID=1961234 RepID=A0ABD3D8I0_9LAMI